MKYLIFSGLIIFMFSCSDISEVSDNSQLKDLDMKEANLDKTKLASNSGIFEMKFTPENHTWQEVDELYRNTQRENPNDIGLELFKTVSIMALINDFKFLEKCQDLEKKLFYLNELDKMESFSVKEYNAIVSHLSTEMSEKDFNSYKEKGIIKGAKMMDYFETNKEQIVAETSQSQFDDLIERNKKDLAVLENISYRVLNSN